MGEVARRALTALALAIAHLAGAATGASAESGDRSVSVTNEITCRRIPLRPPPGWCFSGAWMEDGAALAMVDVGEAILSYGLDGALHGTSPGDGVSFGHPTRLYERFDGSFALQNGPTGWIELAPDLRPRRSLDIRFWTAAWPGGSGWIGGTGPAAVVGDEVVAIVPTKSGDEVVYAVVRIGPDDWNRGAAEYPGGSGPELSAVALPRFGDEADNFFGFSAPTMATVGDRVYLLSPLDGGDLGIYELTPAPRRLEAFPAGFSRTPRLPPPGGRESTTALFAFFESSTMPRGLYARGSFLYLLTREPSAEGTIWRLHPVDPSRDRLLRSLTLPTRANHVFLVPGPEWWAIVEKGAVAGSGRQPIPSAVLVPSTWIEDPASRALTGEPPACGSLSGLPVDASE